MKKKFERGVEDYLVKVQEPPNHLIFRTFEKITGLILKKKVSFWSVVQCTCTFLQIYKKSIKPHTNS